MTKISLLNKNINLVHEWLNEFNKNFGFEPEEKDKSFIVLRYMLQEIRDNLPIENLAHFSAQLPTFIRGLLFEAWNPNILIPKERKAENFITSVQKKLPADLKHIDIDLALQATFATLENKISPAEVGKIINLLPRHIRHMATHPESELA